MAEVPDTADDAIAALGGSPTVDDVLDVTRGFPAREIASAAAARAAGNISALSIVLSLNDPMDISAEGNHQVAWDLFYDNPWDFNEIAGLPAGLGFQLDPDGTLTALEMGIWAYTMQIPLSADDTLKGFFGATGAGMGGEQFICNGTTSAMTTEVLPLPVGGEITSRIWCSVAATGTVHCRPSMTLTRLG